MCAGADVVMDADSNAFELPAIVTLPCEPLVAVAPGDAAAAGALLRLKGAPWVDATGRACDGASTEATVDMDFTDNLNSVHGSVGTNQAKPTLLY